MKVKKVIIEGFHNVIRKEYTFDGINYLHGRNGVGKSTVLQAVQLGLLGYVPGSNKTKQGVFAHANNHMMAIKVVLDDNDQEVSIQRVWVNSKNSVTESVEINPPSYDVKSLIADVELPLFNFDEFTHMTANNLKNWFINYLPKNEFDIAWKLQLKDAVKNLPEGVIDVQLIEDSVDAIGKFHLRGVEEVRQANIYFKNQLSFMKKELERKISTIQSLIHYDDYVAEYSEEELKNLISSTEQKIVSYTVDKQRADRAEALHRELESIGDVDPIAQKYSDAIDTRKSSLEELLQAIQKNKDECTALVAEMSSYQKVVNSGGVCPYTNTSCSSISALSNSYSSKIKELDATLKKLYSEQSTLTEKYNRIRDEVRKYEDNLAEVKNCIYRREAIEKELSGYSYSAIISESVDLSKLQSDLETYKEMYGKAVANRQYNELSEVVLSDKYRLENSIECIKLWVKLTDVNGLQASGSDSNPFESLTDDINLVIKKLFGEDVSCNFINDGKSNSFSFGIMRNGTYVPYTLLSSGEKCMFVLAMYIGLLHYSNSPLRLILIDDFLDHLDDENFKSVIDILTDDVQFIFAGVKLITFAPKLSDHFKVIEIQ